MELMDSKIVAKVVCNGDVIETVTVTRGRTGTFRVKSRYVTRAGENKCSTLNYIFSSEEEATESAMLYARWNLRYSIGEAEIVVD